MIRRFALLFGALAMGTPLSAIADCGLNTYPPLSGYGYNSDQCRLAWQALDWARVIESCTSEAQNAAADRHDFTGLTIAAQSWAKVAIGYDKIAQAALAKQAQQKALAEINAAIDGFSSEKPTPDDESAQSASVLRANLEAPDFYTSAGCAP